MAKYLAVACIRNEDARCKDGDVIELSDSIAEVYLARGLVVPVPSPKPEMAARSGAPNRAISRRGQTKLPPAGGSPDNDE